MKRLLVASLAAGLVLIVVGLIYIGSGRQPNWMRVFVAARTYQEQLTKAGQPIPNTLSPQDLIDRKLLSASDAAGLEGVKIRLLAAPNEQEPEAMLIEVTLTDGTRLAAFADGSVRQLPKNAR